MDQIDRLAAAPTGPKEDFVGHLPMGTNGRQSYSAELASNKPLTQETLRQLLGVQEQVAAASQVELRAARREEGRRDAQKESQKLPPFARPRGNAGLESTKLLLLTHLVATTGNVQGEIRDLDARIGLWNFLQQSEGYFIYLVPFLESEIVRIGCQESNPAMSALSMLKVLWIREGGLATAMHSSAQIQRHRRELQPSSNSQS